MAVASEHHTFSAATAAGDFAVVAALPDSSKSASLYVMLVGMTVDGTTSYDTRRPLASTPATKDKACLDPSPDSEKLSSERTGGNIRMRVHGKYNVSHLQHTHSSVLLFSNEIFVFLGYIEHMHAFLT